MVCWLRDNLVVRLPPAFDNGATLLRRLMSMEPRPTAVFGLNDYVLACARPARARHTPRARQTYKLLLFILP